MIKDLRKVALPFAAHIIRHYTLIAISQQAGPFPVSQQKRSHGESILLFQLISKTELVSSGSRDENGISSCMDPLVVVDAVAECMAYEEKELCKIGNISIHIMLKVAGK